MVAIDANTRENVLNKQVATLGFQTTLCTFKLLFRARFRFNVAGFPRPVRESSSDEPLEELENPSKDGSPKLSLRRSPVPSI